MAIVDLSHLSVEDWPDAEDQTWEFKSSLLTTAQFKEKLPRYVSGFANSGGGCLLWGVCDSSGDPDGGIDRAVGKQPVTDWIDKVIKGRVEPPPVYSLREITTAGDRGRIDDGKSVVAIAVDPGPQAPFQCVGSGAYYFRAGRHTEPAPHSLVEALWARRQVMTPVVKCVSRSSLQDYCLDQLALINLTSTPAFDVAVDARVSWEEEDAGGQVFEVKHDCGIISESSPHYIYTPLRIEAPNGRAWRREQSGMQKKIEKPIVEATWSWSDQAGNEYSESCCCAFESLRMDVPNIARSLSSIGRKLSDLQRRVNVKILKPNRHDF